MSVIPTRLPEYPNRILCLPKPNMLKPISSSDVPLLLPRFKIPVHNKIFVARGGVATSTSVYIALSSEYLPSTVHMQAEEKLDVKLSPVSDYGGVLSLSLFVGVIVSEAR